MRTFDLTTLGLKEHSYKVVANIPYYLSGRLFRIFLESTMQPSSLVFLVQKEVAERIARDTKGSLLSLSVSVFGTPVYVKTVKKGNFTPPPKVDSAVIAINSISHDRFRGIDESFFFVLIHAGFKAKRKQLLGNLSSLFSREVLTHTFSTLSIPLDVRGEDLVLETWLSLAAALNPHR
jgi:16S rRNA (adenine1518-N6/adenine1519-N6)-dimethyltransferase